MNPLLCDNCGCLATDVVAGTRVCESLVCRAELLAQASEPPNGQQTPEDLHPLLIAESRLRETRDAFEEAYDEHRIERSMRFAEAIDLMGRALDIFTDDARALGLMAAPCEVCRELTTQWRMSLPVCSDACQAEIENQIEEAAEREERNAPAANRRLELEEACSRG